MSKGDIQDVKIPRIIIKLAAKFKLKSEDDISLEELLAESPVIDTFIQRCIWRDSIIEDSAIPDNVDLLGVSTHWWKTFEPAVAVPRSNLPHANATVPAKAIVAAGDVTPAHRHVRQVSGMKRPPPDDCSEYSEEEGNVARIRPDESGKNKAVNPDVKEAKRRKVTSLSEELTFRPVRLRYFLVTYETG